MAADELIQAAIGGAAAGGGGGESGIKIGFGLSKGSKTSKGSGVRPSVFETGDDDEKKASRPLVPLDYEDDDGSSRASSKASAPGSLSDKHMAVASRIPKDKDELFKFPVDWTIVERHDLIQGKLRPWVVKKIKEYLGEEEKTLIDFITHQLARHCKPKDLLNELRLVLEEDADLFVQKLWRILIYHVEEQRLAK